MSVSEEDYERIRIVASECSKSPGEWCRGPILRELDGIVAVPDQESEHSEDSIKIQLILETVRMLRNCTGDTILIGKLSGSGVNREKAISETKALLEKSDKIGTKQASELVEARKAANKFKEVVENGIYREGTAEERNQGNGHTA